MTLKNLLINSKLLLITLIFYHCQNKVEDAKKSSSSFENFKKDSLSEIKDATKNQNNSIDSSMIIYEKSFVAPFQGKDEGTIPGNLYMVEEGDYRYLSIKDTSNTIITFDIDKESNINESTWNKMLAGKYNNKRVEVNWKKKTKFIKQAGGYEEMHVLTKVRFLE